MHCASPCFGSFSGLNQTPAQPFASVCFSSSMLAAWRGGGRLRPVLRPPAHLHETNSERGSSLLNVYDRRDPDSCTMYILLPKSI